MRSKNFAANWLTASLQSRLRGSCGKARPTPGSNATGNLRKTTSMTPKQRDAFDEYAVAVRQDFTLARMQARLPGAKAMPPSPESARLRAAFEQRLSVDSKNQFEAKIFPYLMAGKPETEHFDVGLIRRRILQQVLDLGWTSEWFGDFDSSLRSSGNHAAQKAERVGKKYQWIAYHELLARICDNFEFRPEPAVSRDAEEQANGSWVVRYRNIDPSLLLRGKPETPEDQVEAVRWWPACSFSSWSVGRSVKAWIKDADSLPSISSLVNTVDPSSKRPTLLLGGRFSWKSPPVLEVPASARPPTLEVWCHINSYLAEKRHLPRLFAWAEKQNFMGRWMPEEYAWPGVHLREHFWAAPFPAEEKWSTRNFRTGDFPHPFVCTSANYGCEATDLDCSVQRTFGLRIPCQFLFQEMKLVWRGREGESFSQDGKRVFWDPSVSDGGPSALIADHAILEEFLERRGYGIFWTLLGEKNVSQSGGYPFGRLEISGVSFFENGRWKQHVAPKFIGTDRPEEGE